MDNSTSSHNLPDTVSARPQGAVFVLIGPSAVGKNTLIKAVIAHWPQIRRLPTATTRAPRDGEQEGVDHFFVSMDRFEELIKANLLVEYEEVHAGTMYGTMRQPTQSWLDEGQLLIADIDVKGASALKAAFPGQIITIFVLPPSLESLAERMRERGSVSEDELRRRLARARFEMDQAGSADYRVVNGDFETCMQDIKAILREELIRHRQPV